jgi:hypothetical protein
MKRFLFAIAFLALTLPLAAQTNPDPFAPIHFLFGTWEAKGNGPGGVVSSGSYTFAPDLMNNILVRRATTSGACKGPVTFDCDHSDALTIYPESGALHAIYFDNEGHVLHYTITTPTPTTAVFLTDPAQPGPQFRLTYSLTGATMQGKFQMHMPNQPDWNTYLEWTGNRK